MASVTMRLFLWLAVPFVAFSIRVGDDTTVGGPAPPPAPSPVPPPVDKDADIADRLSVLDTGIKATSIKVNRMMAMSPDNGQPSPQGETPGGPGAAAPPGGKPAPAGRQGPVPKGPLTDGDPEMEAELKAASLTEGDSGKEGQEGTDLEDRVADDERKLLGLERQLATLDTAMSGSQQAQGAGAAPPGAYQTEVKTEKEQKDEKEKEDKAAAKDGAGTAEKPASMVQGKKSSMVQGKKSSTGKQQKKSSTGRQRRDHKDSSKKEKDKSSMVQQSGEGDSSVDLSDSRSDSMPSEEEADDSSAELEQRVRGLEDRFNAIEAKADELAAMVWPNGDPAATGTPMMGGAGGAAGGAPPGAGSPPQQQGVLGRIRSFFGAKGQNGGLSHKP